MRAKLRTMIDRARRQKQGGHRTAASALGQSRWVRKVAQTEGWLSLDEARVLYDLARDCSNGCIVEIGSYRGRSTTALALGAQAGGNAPVFAVEPHEEFTGLRGGQFGAEDRRAFFRNMVRSGAYRSVRLVNLPSTAAASGWRAPIELLWLDGDHSYEAVRADVTAWEPHLLTEARIAFHDADDPTLGPLRVIEELVETGQYELVRNGPLCVLARTTR